MSPLVHALFMSIPYLVRMIQTAKHTACSPLTVQPMKG